MKKIKYIVLVIVNFFFINVVNANDIEKITMDIYVDNLGNAHVTEVWVADLEEGTEGYKPYYNLGNSDIVNFNVELNGKSYTTVNDWDIDWSFNEKAYKAGLYKVDGGYELCFGISRYGENTYTLKYTVTNFVSTTADSDMIFWELVSYDLSDKPDYVYIKIYSDFKYDYETPVWGYGNYGGYAYVHEDGFIELIHEDDLEDDEYMTVLAKFPKGTFNTSSVLDNDFNYYYEMAEDGAVSYSDKTTILDILGIVFTIIINIVIIIGSSVVVYKSVTSNMYGTKRLKFNKDYKKFKDVSYFRDIPCNKDIFKAYYISCHYGLVKNQTDFLGAILLKWLKGKNIENIKVTSKFLKKEERAIKLLNDDNLSVLEKELYEMMNRAAVDGVLESNEFSNWCKVNYKQILKWFNKVIDNETMDYVKQGIIVEEKKTFNNVYHVSNILDNTAREMYGLKKFLNEFTNIKDKESLQVHLFDEYLMYAQIFGIAKKVAKEFKKLYPDVISDEYYDDIIFIHTISYRGVNAATSARERAENYSSGGGGFSSGGGGTGSFGGGGGGGFR